MEHKLTPTMATKKARQKKPARSKLADDPVQFLTRETTKFQVGLRQLDTKGAPAIVLKVPGVTFVMSSTGANVIAVSHDTSVATNVTNWATKLGAVFAEYAIVGITWFVQASANSDDATNPVSGSVAWWVDEQLNTAPTSTTTQGRRRMVTSINSDNSTSCGKITWKPRDFADLTFQLATTVAFSPAYLKVYGDAASYNLTCPTSFPIARVSQEYTVVFRNYL